MTRTPLKRVARLARTGYLRRTGRLAPVSAVPTEPSPAKTAYEAELDEQRPKVQRRSQGRCEARLPGCTGAATHVHHRKLRAQGGDNGLHNLLACCSSCHSRIHLHPFKSYGAGFLVRSTDDPADIIPRVGRHTLWENAE